MKLSSTKEITIKKPELPQVWDYQESIKKTKLLVYKWQNLTREVAEELWVAREMLSEQAEHAGRPPEGGTKVPRYSWSQYCLDIGSSRQVVNRWLIRWFPKEKVKYIPKPGEVTEALQFAIIAIRARSIF